MSTANAILLTPALDLHGVWGGVWVQGAAEETAVIRDRLGAQMPHIHILLEAALPLATGIADASQLEQAKAQGATWFAGPFIAHPQPVIGTVQDAGRANLLRLMSLVAQDADTAEIESVFKRDPGLSFHLFRLVNSPGIGLSRKISSFNDAILVLGRRQLQRWVQLLLYASKKQESPSPLLAFAAMRGRMMEKLAQTRGRDVAVCEQAFMTGIFSLLDSLLGMRMDDIAQAVRLPESVQHALLDHQGELGELLDWVEGLQSGGVISLPGGIAEDQCLDMQLEAMAWASSVGAEMG
jgi:EAL and modified HD-GYP domain-containing signal transduction protein